MDRDVQACRLFRPFRPYFSLYIFAKHDERLGTIMSTSILAVILLFADPVWTSEHRAVLEWDLDVAPILSLDETERIASKLLARDNQLGPRDRTAILMRRGVARYLQGAERADQAAKDFEEVLNQEPTDVAAQGYLLSSRAMTLYFARRYNELESLSRSARQFVKDNPRSSFARWIYVDVFLLLPRDDMEQYLEALNELDEAIRLDPSAVRNIARRATVKFLINDFAGSKSDAELAITAGRPPEPKFRERMNWNVARCAMAMGDFDGAMSVLPDTCQAFPNRFYPQLVLWMCASALEKSATAELIADRMIERFPDRPEGQIAKAVSLALRVDHKGAQHALEAASSLKTNPDLTEWGRGRAYEMAENWKGAVESYEAASQRVPLRIAPPSGNDVAFSIDRTLRLGLLRAAAPDESARHGVKAVREGKRLLEVLDECPERRMAQLIVACGYAESRDFDEAVECVDEALRGPRLQEGEKLLCSQLRKQFLEGRPYRLSLDKNAEPHFTIPAVACCMGRLKKIEREKEFGEP